MRAKAEDGTHTLMKGDEVVEDRKITGNGDLLSQRRKQHKTFQSVLVADIHRVLGTLVDKGSEVVVQTSGLSEVGLDVIGTTAAARPVYRI